MNERDASGIVIVQGLNRAIEHAQYDTGHMPTLFQRLLNELKDRRRAMGIPDKPGRDDHFDYSTIGVDPFDPSEHGGA